MSKRARRQVEPDPPSLAAGAADRGYCALCGRWPRLTKEGLLAEHNEPDPWDDTDTTKRCDGSGTPPWGATQLTMEGL